MLSLSIILVIEPLYRDSLYKTSLTWIPTLQSGASTTLVNFWAFWSDFCLKSLSLMPILISSAITSDKVRMFYFITMMTFVTFIMNVTKLGYHDPRPFWDNS
jgi:thiol-disulfide isomerase/thioredoxin